jgi:DNA-binding PadR family transcriptional regulator
MDYLKLQTALAIMEKVAARDGALTWYAIVKDIDQLGLEKIPSSYYVLQELANRGLLRIEPPEGGNLARYWLTDAGGQYLSQHVAHKAHRYRMAPRQRDHLYGTSCHCRDSRPSSSLLLPFTP